MMVKFGSCVARPNMIRSADQSDRKEALSQCFIQPVHFFHTLDRYVEAYRQLHTGSGACWGRGLVELPKRITNVRPNIFNSVCCYCYLSASVSCTPLSPDVVHDLVFPFTGNTGIGQEDLEKKVD